MTTTVETKYGQLEGVVEDGLTVFKGIPFAKPPIGDLRFRPPQPPEPWEGARKADAFGATSLQPPPMQLLAQGEVLEQSEDCLTLNIWTPAADGRRRPVMVWIHGGAFVTGSGSSPIYRGRHLATRGDVVVVTINYRLGALGFLSHPSLRDAETGAAGNWGLLDQVAALQWVSDHIERFGGDAGNVTIFGESAGSMSVSTLLGTPAASGLFQRAIAQSGGPVATAAATSEQVAARFFAAAGVDVGDVTGLRALAGDGILDAQNKVQLQGAGAGLPFTPVVDGSVIPVPPQEAIAGGSSAGVALLVGTNRDEMKLFAMGNTELLGADESTLVTAIGRTLGDEGATVIEEYRAARDARGQSVQPLELWNAIESDRVFRIPATRMAEAQAATGTDVYDYFFTYESPAMGGLLGSCHALEIPFVFGTLVTKGIDAFTGSSSEALALSEKMQDAWLAFARSGNPSTDALGQWPTYDADRRAVMILGPETGVEEKPLEAERAVWDTRSTGGI